MHQDANTAENFLTAALDLAGLCAPSGPSLHFVIFLDFECREQKLRDFQHRYIPSFLSLQCFSPDQPSRSAGRRVWSAAPFMLLQSRQLPMTGARVCLMHSPLVVCWRFQSLLQAFWLALDPHQQHAFQQSSSQRVRPPIGLMAFWRAGGR